MKEIKILLFILSIFGNITTVISQKNKINIVEYKVTPNKSKIKKNKKSVKGIAQNKRIKGFYSTPAFFKLIFNDKISIYKLKNIEIKNDNHIKVNFFEIIGGGNSIYYHNKKTNEIIEESEKFGDEFLIYHDKLKWNITNETKKIGVYNCYKVTTEKQGKIETAWFTPEIPYSFGPKEYFGLPGLILQISIGNIDIIATKVELNSNKKIKFIKPTKGIKIKVKDYHKKIKELGKNMGF